MALLALRLLFVEETDDPDGDVVGPGRECHRERVQRAVRRAARVRDAARGLEDVGRRRDGLGNVGDFVELPHTVAAEHDVPHNGPRDRLDRGCADHGVLRDRLAGWFEREVAESTRHGELAVDAAVLQRNTERGDAVALAGVLTRGVVLRNARDDGAVRVRGGDAAVAGAAQVYVRVGEHGAGRGAAARADAAAVAHLVVAALERGGDGVAFARDAPVAVADLSLADAVANEDGEPRGDEGGGVAAVVAVEDAHDGAHGLRCLRAAADRVGVRERAHGPHQLHGGGDVAAFGIRRLWWHHLGRGQRHRTRLRVSGVSGTLLLEPLSCRGPERRPGWAGRRGPFVLPHRGGHGHAARRSRLGDRRGRVDGRAHVSVLVVFAPSLKVHERHPQRRRDDGGDVLLAVRLGE
mmetsp:Transcript_3599/g.11259  ORF Transcript_3599/g.11259 Transcript_3599/m.11259 type:complete len:408 (-) Transcript_3599:400-1623(-)